MHKAGPNGDDLVTNVTITNPSSNSAVAFFLRADVRRGTAAGTADSGDNEVLPITWSDNDITLWPGQSETVTASFKSSLLKGASPVVSVEGWNVPQSIFAASQSAAAVAAVHAASATPGTEHFGNADGQPLVKGTATPGTGSAPGTAAADAAHSATGPDLTVSAVAGSPDTTPATSFTQGDDADTYTLTVRNSGSAATDGTTPVTVTDILDPNLNYTSISGSGWTCDDRNNPPLVCTESAAGPSVAAPLHAAGATSYLPITPTVPGAAWRRIRQPGLHRRPARHQRGHGERRRAVSAADLAGRPDAEVVGVPQLTADNAV